MPPKADPTLVNQSNWNDTPVQFREDFKNLVKNVRTETKAAYFQTLKRVLKGELGDEPLRNSVSGLLTQHKMDYTVVDNGDVKVSKFTNSQWSARPAPAGGPAPKQEPKPEPKQAQKHQDPVVSPVQAPAAAAVAVLPHMVIEDDEPHGTPDEEYDDYGPSAVSIQLEQMKKFYEERMDDLGKELQRKDETIAGLQKAGRSLQKLVTVATERKPALQAVTINPVAITVAEKPTLLAGVVTEVEKAHQTHTVDSLDTSLSSAMSAEAIEIGTGELPDVPLLDGEGEVYLLDKSENVIKDQMPRSRIQRQFGRCPNIRVTAHPVNMSSILKQIRPPTKFTPTWNPKQLHPNINNFYKLDPFHNY
jgi:DNA-binding protein YbaB